VLDEIGVDIASQLSAAPKGSIKTKNAENVSRYISYYIFFASPFFLHP
ncbi:vacuolar protein sorting-associated protein 2-like, partial [Trifolium medium]|nr:vacuolar protein sorting-associated protein 2-like [Trifolium medium]